MRSKLSIILVFVGIAVGIAALLFYHLDYTDRECIEKVTTLGKIIDEPAVYVWWGVRAEDGIYLGLGILNKNGEQKTSILKFTPSKGFEEVFNINDFNQREAVVWTGDRVLIFGGSILKDGKYTPTDQILSFSPNSKQLKILNASLPYPTSDITAVWDGEKAYLFLRNETGVPEVYAFILANETIAKVDVSCPIEHPGGCIHSVVWYKDKAYFFCGKGIACFDPTNRTFEWVAYTDRVWVRAVTITNKDIFAFGGSLGVSNLKDEILRFEPETGELCKMETKLPTPRGQSVAVWDGKYIYIFGGYTESGYANEVLRYDYKEDECR